MKPAISVTNLSKKYTLRHRQGRTYLSLRDVIWDGAKVFGRRMFPSDGRHVNSGDREPFWAVKGVNFEIEQGARVGIIGRNGAGKSTLLKLLSRITEPTEGRIFIKGRLSSLLEVGTGFHPELTGRENIFFNGAILGMTKDEIRRKFDEIVAFAEIERFVDTPVKHYSSGMYLRLAFAVAAHLEPDILIVDEVLAVGDLQFQKKCLGKMEEVSKEGRTLLFVSHNLVAIETLCPHSMLMTRGSSSVIAPSRHVIEEYLKEVSSCASVAVRDRIDRSGRGNIRVTNITFDAPRYISGEDIAIELELENKYPFDVKVRLGLNLYSTNDGPLISCDSYLQGWLQPLKASSVTRTVCKLYAPPLNCGEYWIHFAIFYNDEPEDWICYLARFSMGHAPSDAGIVTNHFPVLAKFEWIDGESSSTGN